MHKLHEFYATILDSASVWKFSLSQSFGPYFGIRKWAGVVNEFAFFL